MPGCGFVSIQHAASSGNILYRSICLLFFNKQDGIFLLKQINIYVIIKLDNIVVVIISVIIVKALKQGSIYEL